MTLLSPADYHTLNAAIADLRAWDARDVLAARAGGHRNAMIGPVAADLERLTDADEERELPDVLRLFPYRETLDFYGYGLIANDFAGLEDAREVRLAVLALLKQLREEARRADRSAAEGG